MKFRDLILLNLRNLQNYMADNDIDEIKMTYGRVNSKIELISCDLMGANSGKILSPHSLNFLSFTLGSTYISIDRYGHAVNRLSQDISFSNVTINEYISRLFSMINDYYSSLREFSSAIGGFVYSGVLKKTGKFDVLLSVETTDAEVGDGVLKYPLDFDPAEVERHHKKNGLVSKVSLGNIYIDYPGSLLNVTLLDLLSNGSTHPNIVRKTSGDRFLIVNQDIDGSKYKEITLTETIVKQGFDRFYMSRFDGVDDTFIEEDIEEDTSRYSLSSIKKSGQVNIRDENGNTALMLCVLIPMYSFKENDDCLSITGENVYTNVNKASIKYAEALYEIGANLSLRNNQDDDVLSLAVKHQNVSFLSWLIDLDKSTGYSNFESLTYGVTTLSSLAENTGYEHIIAMVNEYILSREIAEFNTGNSQKHRKEKRCTF